MRINRSAIAGAATAAVLAGSGGVAYAASCPGMSASAGTTTTSATTTTTGTTTAGTTTTSAVTRHGRRHRVRAAHTTRR